MIIDVGFGYIMKPEPYANEQDRLLRQMDRQRQERRWCELDGLDYDAILRKRGEKCLLSEMVEVV